MIKRIRQKNTLRVCLQHNNKYIRVLSPVGIKKILSNNYSIYRDKNIVHLSALKGKKLYFNRGY